MSGIWTAATWAQQQDIPPGPRYVLLTLVLHKNFKTGQCNPSQAMLARETGYSERTIRTHLDYLEAPARELIKRQHQRRSDGAPSADNFVINFDQDEWELVRKTDKDKRRELPVGPEPTGNSRQTNRQFSPGLIEEPLNELHTRSPSGDLSAAGRAVAAPSDLKSRIFGPALDWLSEQSGRSKDKLRSMVGRWCRDHGDGRVLEIMTQAARAGAIEPIAWIERTLTEQRDGRRRDNLGGLTAGQAAVAGILGRDPG